MTFEEWMAQVVGFEIAGAILVVGSIAALTDTCSRARADGAGGSSNGFAEAYGARKGADRPIDDDDAGRRVPV